jgi:hypothetical protein
MLCRPDVHGYAFPYGGPADRYDLKFLQHRRAAIAAVLATTVAAVFATAVPANAVAHDGNHTHEFTCGAQGEIAILTIEYDITTADDNHAFLQFKSARWSTSPARALNALRVDLEQNQGQYREISPPWGGSSVTHDDVSSSFSQDPYTVDSWPAGNVSPHGKGLWRFSNEHSPKLRVRCYGMGPGDTPSDASHNDTVVLPVK